MTDDGNPRRTEAVLPRCERASEPDLHAQHVKEPGRHSSHLGVDRPGTSEHSAGNHPEDRRSFEEVTSLVSIHEGPGLHIGQKSAGLLEPGPLGPHVVETVRLREGDRTEERTEGHGYGHAPQADAGRYECADRHTRPRSVAEGPQQRGPEPLAPDGQGSSRLVTLAPSNQADPRSKRPSGRSRRPMKSRALLGKLQESRGPPGLCPSFLHAAQHRFLELGADLGPEGRRKAPEQATNDPLCHGDAGTPSLLAGHERVMLPGSNTFLPRAACTSPASR